MRPGILCHVLQGTLTKSAYFACGTTTVMKSMRHFSMLQQLCSAPPVWFQRRSMTRNYTAANYGMCSKLHAAGRATIPVVNFQLNEIFAITN